MLSNFESDGKGGYKETPNMVEGKYIEDATIAALLLPVQSGFFFGSTDYDEYYLDDIIHTRDMMKSLLKEDAEGGYYYRSSW